MTEVRLTKARTFELDPDKKYLIQIKEGALHQADMEKLREGLKKLDIKNALFVVMPKGKHLKITEAKK